MHIHMCWHIYTAVHTKKQDSLRSRCVVWTLCVIKVGKSIWLLQGLDFLSSVHCFLSKSFIRKLWSNRPHDLHPSCVQTTLCFLFLSNKWCETHPLLHCCRRPSDETTWTVISVRTGSSIKHQHQYFLLLNWLWLRQIKFWELKHQIFIAKLKVFFVLINKLHKSIRTYWCDSYSVQLLSGGSINNIWLRLSSFCFWSKRHCSVVQVIRAHILWKEYLQS